MAQSSEQGAQGKYEIYKMQSVQMGTLFFWTPRNDPLFYNLSVIARTTKEDEAILKSQPKTILLVGHCEDDEGGRSNL